MLPEKNEEWFEANTLDLDIEVLQTDIQRFVAILGFCLMAIFALMQSMPVTPSGKPNLSAKQEPSPPNKIATNSQLNQQTIESMELKKNQRPPAPVKQNKHSPPRPYRKKTNGVYVAFQSDTVFEDLMHSGKVALYIHVAGVSDVFQVTPGPSGFRFIMTSLAEDLDLWRVSASSIPASVVEGFNSWTALSQREKMYIVGLTRAIATKIRGKKAVSGQLIIGPGGRVTHHE